VCVLVSLYEVINHCIDDTDEKNCFAIVAVFFLVPTDEYVC